MIKDAIVTGALNLVLFGLLVAFCRLVHGDGRCSFLLHGDTRGWRLFLKGAIAGLVSFAAYPFIVILFGLGHFDTNTGALPIAIACAISWGLGFLPVALFEEALFRGYLLPQSLARFPKWVAIVFPSLLFGALHASSYGSDGAVWLGVLNAFLFGIVFSLIVIRSQSLMCAIGLHWAWNLAQVIFLPPTNGEIEPLFSLQVHGGLWTGAQFYPETGFIETVIVVVLGASVFLWLRQAGPAAGAKIGDSILK